MEKKPRREGREKGTKPKQTQTPENERKEGLERKI